jgi:hypothetical protein
VTTQWLAAFAIILAAATHAAAIGVATGFSDKGDAKDPASWITGVQEAARTAKGRLGPQKADLVLVWDNIPVPDADAESRILPAIAAEFPGARVCGQHEPSRPQYSPYNEEKTTIGCGVALIPLWVGPEWALWPSGRFRRRSDHVPDSCLRLQGRRTRARAPK